VFIHMGMPLAHIDRRFSPVFRTRGVDSLTELAPQLQRNWRRSGEGMSIFPISFLLMQFLDSFIAPAASILLSSFLLFSWTIAFSSLERFFRGSQ